MVRPMKPRLLVVELHHLGDAVMSIPFIKGAREKFDIHVLCRPATREVYELLAEPPSIHTWEPPWADDRSSGALESVTAARRKGRALRRSEFAVTVCVWADARAEILMAETLAPQRIGFPMTRGNYYAADLPWRRNRRWLGRALESLWQTTHPANPLLTRRLAREAPEQSHMRCWEQIAEALGISCDYTLPWIKTPRAHVRGGRPVLAVHAQARVPSKQWPAERWRGLLDSPSVRDRFDIVEILPPGADAVTSDGMRKLPTPDLAALVAALHGADAVLCHDSFPGHLAAALGKPVIAIFGSGEPDWFAPWGNRDRAVQKSVCPLHPCIDRCGMDSYLCLEAVSKNDIIEQLQRLDLPSS